MEGKDNAVTGPLLAVVLVALGVIAIVVKAGKFVSDRDFFNAVGILVLIGGIYLIYKGARTDGPRDMIFGGCMLAVMGFVLYVTDGPGFLIFWLAVIVVAELGPRYKRELRKRRRGEDDGRRPRGRRRGPGPSGGLRLGLVHVPLRTGPHIRRSAVSGTVPFRVRGEGRREALNHSNKTLHPIPFPRWEKTQSRR